MQKGEKKEPEVKKMTTTETFKTDTEMGTPAVLSQTEMKSTIKEEEANKEEDLETAGAVKRTKKKDPVK